MNSSWKQTITEGRRIGIAGTITFFWFIISGNENFISAEFIVLTGFFYLTLMIGQALGDHEKDLEYEEYLKNKKSSHQP